MDTKIVVATHKPYFMPEDGIYFPLHVGKEGKPDIGFAGDDTGDNISSRNPTFCELTGLYWAWKNLQCGYLGLAQYRRHFSLKGRLFRCVRGAQASILSSEELCALLKCHDILVPRRRRYYVETVYSHYAHTHHKEHLDLVRAIIAERCPNYLEAFDKVTSRTSAHMFNMFVMRRDLADEYCAWLFDILFELEKRIDLSGYSAFQARLFGRVSEILFDVWLTRRQARYCEIPYIYMEKIDYRRKVSAFVMAKLFHKKYDSSF